MKTAFAILLTILSLLPTLPAQKSYPTGPSHQQQEGGLAFELNVPATKENDPRPGMIVVLHGAGGTATGMAGALAFMAPKGYVVVAPKSTGQVWTPGDVEKVRELVRDLERDLRVDHERLHAVGFSNGGWNLPLLAFDEKMHFLSATFVASGWQGRRPPKKARKRMGILALVGSEDGNRPHALQIPKLLGKSVRRAEVRVQPGLGHAWPRKLMPFFAWWIEALEGRCQPGVDMNFEWITDLDAARATMVQEKRKGMIYFYSREEEDGDLTRKLQCETFFDPRVRFYGAQLVPILLDIAEHPDLREAFRLKEGPAIVLLDQHFKEPKVLPGKVSASKLAKALRRRARKKIMPKGR